MKLWETFREASQYKDALTGRKVTILTTKGAINQTPTYHTNSGFTFDGEHLVLISIREGATWVIRADTDDGALTPIWRAPGIGDRSYIHRCMGLKGTIEGKSVDGRGVAGNRLTVAPHSGLAIFTCERSLIATNIYTGQERTLIHDVGNEWIFGAPCVSPDERWVAIALSSAHPQFASHREITHDYRDFSSHRLKIVRIPIEGGPMQVLFDQMPAQSAHCSFCPLDGDVLYFDLDLPPGYWGGSDNQTPRIWLINTNSRRPHPLKEKYPGPFQTHQAWLWDKPAMAYHGPLPSGGTYIGITDITGKTLWEQSYPLAKNYGHLTPDVKRPALVLDGDFSQDMLQFLYYDTGSNEPHLEPICRHGTEWGTLPGQYSHPHPLTDPTGRLISFTRAVDQRSEVCLVEI